MSKHKWNSEFCSCGQDSVTCQSCGKRVCGTLVQWVKVPRRGYSGNVCAECLSLHETATKFDALYAENVANGFERVAEIRPAGDGFELLELTAMMSGKPAWKRVLFDRRREECVAAASRRGLIVK